MLAYNKFVFRACSQRSLSANVHSVEKSVNVQGSVLGLGKENCLFHGTMK